MLRVPRPARPDRRATARSPGEPLRGVAHRSPIESPSSAGRNAAKIRGGGAGAGCRAQSGLRIASPSGVRQRRRALRPPGRSSDERGRREADRVAGPTGGAGKPAGAGVRGSRFDMGHGELDADQPLGLPGEPYHYPMRAAAAVVQVHSKAQSSMTRRHSTPSARHPGGQRRARPRSGVRRRAA